MTKLKYSSISLHKLPLRKGFLKGHYRYKNKEFRWKYPKYNINVGNLENVFIRKHLLKQLTFLFHLILQKVHIKKNIFPFTNLPENIIKQITQYL